VLKFSLLLVTKRDIFLLTVIEIDQCFSYVIETANPFFKSRHHLGKIPSATSEPNTYPYTLGHSHFNQATPLVWGHVVSPEDSPNHHVLDMLKIKAKHKGIPSIFVYTLLVSQSNSKNK